MKRDFDLIRLMLLQLEEPTPENLAAMEEKYSQIDLLRHAYLMKEAGLIDGNDVSNARDGAYLVKPTRLTWAGHDFLEAARKETLWQKAKDAVGKSATGLTIEGLKLYFKHLIGQYAGSNPTGDAANE